MGPAIWAGQIREGRTYTPLPVLALARLFLRRGRSCSCSACLLPRPSTPSLGVNALALEYRQEPPNITRCTATRTCS